MITAKNLLFIIGLIFTMNIFADDELNDDFIVEENSIIKPDLKSGIMGKLFPIQGVAYAEGGLSLVIWGDEKSGTPMYGYVRLAARYTTAGVLNRGESFVLRPIRFHLPELLPALQ